MRAGMSNARASCALMSRDACSRVGDDFYYSINVNTVANLTKDSSSSPQNCHDDLFSSVCFVFFHPEDFQLIPAFVGLPEFP